MRLSWNEIRARAAVFAQEWADATYERGEAQSFYNDFFNVFGVNQRRVASFEAPVKKLGNKRGFIDLFWKGVLLVEQKSAGRDLSKAKEQAFDYFPGIKEAELPRYILVSDFQNFELYDLEDKTEIKFSLKDLPKKVECFRFILGLEKRIFKDQDPVNIEASELMGKLHDSLKESGYVGHDLERLLVRLVFCLFADDTGIFEQRGIFLDLVEQRSCEDGSDLGRLLHEFFEILNTPEKQRQKNLDERLDAFPYINGNLFQERLGTANFDTKTREALIEACKFDWGKISPAIFGSLFQSVMDNKERRAKGAHYTSEQNIMKLIQPLFLDDLRAEFIKIKQKRDGGRRKKLKAFHTKLAKLKFFDPACGCGNFLIIAYRELRELEIEILRELYGGEALQRELDAALLSKINVDQFYGIEISEFPARIAEVALWIMDHIMNIKLGQAFGFVYARIPLKAAPHIHFADALETDWQAVLSSENCSYVLGNPPFSGAKTQDTIQRGQIHRLSGLKHGGTLDYVCAWFLKAGEYIQRGNAKIGFVATNSITQGEQVAQLWPILFERYKLEIRFAHRTFLWQSDARGAAHVYVVIIGLAKQGKDPALKRLYSYSDIKEHPDEKGYKAISPYLIGMNNLKYAHLTVKEAARSLMDCPRMVMGSKPIDGGHYIFTAEQKVDFLQREPEAAPYLRPYIGAKEAIQGGERYILALQNASPSILATLPLVKQRIQAVKAFRKASKSEQTRKLAETPTRYHLNIIPDTPFLMIPSASSAQREYVPMKWADSPVIPSNLVLILLNAELYIFAILESAMHMNWVREIGGRLGNGYRYSIGLTYNTFPWPELTEKTKNTLSVLAQVVLDARNNHPEASLAELYDADLMPANLRKAHRNLDKAVDKLYRPVPFTSEGERLEHLFSLYERMTVPLHTSAKHKKRKKKK